MCLALPAHSALSSQGNRSLHEPYKGVCAIHSPVGLLGGTSHHTLQDRDHTHLSFLSAQGATSQCVACRLCFGGPQTHRGGSTQARAWAVTPGFDIAVIFCVPTWVDSWFFLLLINVIF